MPKRRILKVILVVATGVAAANAAAFTNEPKGFGQDVWGKSFRAKEFRKCVAIDSDPESQLCYPHESGSVRIVDTEIALTNLVYGFWRGRLESVEFRGDATQILQDLQQRFGTPRTTDRFKSGSSYEWAGAVTRMLVLCDNEPSLCTVTLRSTQLLEQRAQAEREHTAKNRHRM